MYVCMYVCRRTEHLREFLTFKIILEYKAQ